MPSPFAARLRQHRIAAGFSQEALAEAAHVSVSAIGAYERGINAAPHQETVELLVQALNLTEIERSEFVRLARRKPRAAPAQRPKSKTDPMEALPADTTSFIGRDDEVAAVAALLTDHRFVTVTGIGGIGKTRLALQAARSVSAAYPDGVAFVDLGAISDHTLVAAKVAAALNIGISDAGEDLLAATIGPRRVLVILDNCEHLIEATGSVAATLMRRTQAVSILATSRERLRISGEKVYRLAVLPLATAAQLFVARASSGDAAFTANEANVALINDICRMLDGIPLALELAASRVQSMGLATLQVQLTDQLTVLAGGNRDVPTRQRTLNATLAWSYDLLDQHEHIVFRRLGAFAGGWTLAAAYEVCGDETLSDAQIADALASLVDKSLAGLDIDAAPRYHLLRVTQLYACSKSKEADEHFLLASRHAGWMARMASSAHSEITMPRGAWHAKYDLEIDNMRAAIEWCLSDGRDPVLAAGIITGFVHVWLDSGLVSEHRLWAQRALEAINEELHPREAALLLRMIMRTGIGLERTAAGERAIAIFSNLNDDVALAHTLGAQASLYQKSGEIDAAQQAADRAAQLYVDNDLGATAPFAFVLTTQALLAAARGDFDRAKSRIENVLDLAIQRGDDYAASYSNKLLAGFAFLTGDVDEAIERANETLATAREMGFRQHEMLLIADRACYNIARRNIDAAFADAGAVVSMAREKDPSIAATAITHVATCCSLSDELDVAARLLGFVDAFTMRTGATRTTEDDVPYQLLVNTLSTLLSENDLIRYRRSGARLSLSEACDAAVHATESLAAVD